MLKKGLFFDLLNRCAGVDFDSFLRTHQLYAHYVGVHDYLLPFDYGDAEREYHAVRNGCAMFDACSSRKYRIRGRGAGAFLDYLLTRPVSSSPPMRGIYAVFCNDDGSVKDDVVVYKYSDDDYVLMPAFDHTEHFEAVRMRKGIEDVEIVPWSEQLAGFSLQGPLSATVLQRLGCDGIELLKPFDLKEYRVAGIAISVARMGFTGDLGYECWFEPQRGEAIAARLTAASKAADVEIVGYGLIALEACRIEAGLVVPGRECATDYAPLPGMQRSPFDLNLGWLVKFDGRDFVGRDALQVQQAQGARYTLLSFDASGRHRLPRAAQLHTEVAGGDLAIGTITSASWSWGLNRTIGLASVERDFAGCGCAHLYVGEQRLDLRLSPDRLLTLPRRTQVPAPISVSRQAATA